MPVTIAPISNKADWKGAIFVVENGSIPVDTSLATDIKMELLDPQTNNTALKGSLSTGEITAQDPINGTYSFYFPASVVQSLKEKEYLFGAKMLIEGQTIQLFRENIFCYDGIVR